MHQNCESRRMLFQNCWDEEDKKQGGKGYLCLMETDEIHFSDFHLERFLRLTSLEHFFKA